jgi:hypothetical protein
MLLTPMKQEVPCGNSKAFSFFNSFPSQPFKYSGPGGFASQDKQPVP